MKAITEFQSVVLTKGLNAKTALAAEGKTPEEIQQNLGESFKFEGDKLKHFVASLDIATANPQNLRRVVVMSLNEGEVAPAKAVKVEEHYYIPEMLVLTFAKPEAAPKGGRRGGPGGPGGNKAGGGKSAPKSSPWGMSPEEKAAKNKGPAPKN